MDYRLFVPMLPETQYGLGRGTGTKMQNAA